MQHDVIQTVRYKGTCQMFERITQNQSLQLLQWLRLGTSLSQLPKCVITYHAIIMHHRAYVILGPLHPSLVPFSVVTFCVRTIFQGFFTECYIPVPVHPVHFMHKPQCVPDFMWDYLHLFNIYTVYMRWLWSFNPNKVAMWLLLIGCNYVCIQSALQ